jgi:hypothetical protein
MSRRRTSYEHEKRRKELERKKKKELKAEIRRQKPGEEPGLPGDPAAVPAEGQTPEAPPADGPETA